MPRRYLGQDGDVSHELTIMIGDEPFDACWQDALAPKTCTAFRRLLPWSNRIVHVRWSGEACWVPLGDFRLHVGYENATSHPLPGQVLFYPGGRSEAEVLVAYGSVRFGSKAGQLAGNPFLTIVNNLDRLAEIGREILWGGARRIAFDSTAPLPPSLVPAPRTTE